jgi:UrcA family protein
MHRAILFAALAISSALATTAVAQPPVAGGPDSLTVRYAAAELNTAAGASNLALRIRVAANRLCGGDNPVTRTASTIADCRRATEARAAAGLGAPLLDRALGLPAETGGLASR